MQPCPNCGELVEADKTMCPNCGRSLTPPPVPADDIWPPPPEGFVAPQPTAPPVGKLITGKPWGDYALGIVSGLGSVFMFGIGLPLIPILYFTMRRTYPMFARGIGHVGLLWLVVLLGAFIVCMAGLINFSP